MGESKLLLPWGPGLASSPPSISTPSGRSSAGQERVIDFVLRAWTHSDVFQVFVVVRNDDHDLAAACRRWPVQLVLPERHPADMKESIQCGLSAIKAASRPSETDRCFIAPADLPTLTSRMIDRLIAAEADASTIVVPQFGTKRGHPPLLPWPLVDEIFDLPDGEGVDRVIKRHPKLAVPFAASDRVTDIDTPEDYQRLLGLVASAQVSDQKG